MQSFLKFVQILRRPFPQQDSKDFLRTITLISVFVTFFLYLFRPFDMDQIESKVFLICLGFGMVSFAMMAVYGFGVSRVLKNRLPEEKWTFGLWIMDTMALIFFISLGNFLFVRGYFGTMRWEFFPRMIYSTFLIGIFPVGLIGVLTLFRAEKRYRDIAEEINRKPAAKTTSTMRSTIRISGIPIDQIRYIEALQNYIRIAYLDESGQLRSATERATLKSVLDESEGSALLRCHRSFIVNRDYIEEISGNAQGLILTLSKSDKTVPVSRSYVPLFRSS